MNVRASILVLIFATAAQAQAPTLELKPFPALGPGALQGHYRVWEDRAAESGRKLTLRVVVLRATGSEPKPDPVFLIAGGPGQASTAIAAGHREHWMREDRDLVFVDQRGTAGNHRLRVDLLGSDGDLQAYLEPMFQVEPFRAALPKLQARADLTRYTTPIAMDDLNEVREALGYDKINLSGGSYGTRASLVYMRRHTKTVRTAILNGVAPMAFTNPLFHARGAQQAFERIVAAVQRPEFNGAYANLHAELDAVLERLEKEPAEIEFEDPDTKERVKLRLGRAAFAEALRVMMYNMATSRTVPRLVHRAYQGDYAPVARTGLRTNRGLRRSLAFGMLMCVVGSEDIPRITEAAIVRETAGCFLRDDRVRQQMAVAKFWPRGEMPAGFGEPVSVPVPTLIFSGRFDPVTGPEWGEEAARHLPNSAQVVVPGAHDRRTDPCSVGIMRQFLARGSVAGLDTSCVAELPEPRFFAPR